MRRYGMVFLALVLAVTSLISSAAYNVVGLSNGALALTTSGDAVLEVTPQAGHEGNPYGWQTGYLGPGNKDGAARMTGGRLVFDFTRAGEGSLGVQPNSSYTWHNMFMVRNVYSRAVECTVYGEFTGLPAGLAVSIKEHSATEWTSLGAGGSVSAALSSSGASGNHELYLDLMLTIGSQVSLGTIEGNIIVSGIYHTPNDPPEPDLGSLTVYVVKADGGDVAGLMVSLTGAANSAAPTDSAGVARFGGLPSGTYSVNVSAPGYTSDGPAAVTLSGQPLHAEVTLRLTSTSEEQGPPDDEPEGEDIEDQGEQPGGQGGETDLGDLPKTGSPALVTVTVRGLTLVAAGGLLAGRRRRAPGRKRR